MRAQILQDFNSFGFQYDLLDWYYENKRNLPWRESQDPYKVWVSEIMLQQTKVDTVIPYFERFLTKFPTVYDLAKADEQDVLKTWEGLGYYSRARNLQSAVKEVVEKYGGKIPDTPDELGSLKGVGPYTKGAILSIAYNQPEPAVDGNVMRVFSRVLKIEEDIAKAKTKKTFESVVREVISKEDPSSFNQAIMDLGATICTPTSPACLLCPVQEYCRAFAEGVQEDLPIKTKAKKQKKKSYAVLMIKDEAGRYIIEKRPDNGLLANLWQFPMIPLDEVTVDHVSDWLYKEYGLSVKLGEKLGDISHVFSHLKWELVVYAAVTSDAKSEDERLKFVDKQEVEEYPFPVSHQKMMKYL
ncbi:A/G-specific adenine glycosylase [Oceanobacillus halophilus]|uniref:Adenine DNA glycosylase n=1 Tax=Oceanobacillus halophilus TaxID=930130 RepID=A0A494ZY39_9BACI|nr:A/G-specific adenine glycosylase [Oceanobacillus halophilus]RKQ31405.1 A/G-specific adenine glycosylase [Oceanobacillus halophilus]